MTSNQTTNTTPQQAAEYLRLSLAKLGEMALPVTPQNYSLFYVYHSGQSKELNKVMDEILSADETFSEELVEKLFSQYVCHCSSIDMEKLNREILQAVAQILGAILDFAGQAALSNKSLGSHLEKMANTSEPAEVLRIASDIIADTRRFVDNTQIMEEAMQETTTQIEMLQEELVQARQEATIDALTGLHNRRGLDISLQASLDETVRIKKPLCVLMIDIDHFKAINDTHGHLIGDKVLISVGKLLSNQVRGDDYVARYGGEEFIVILQETPITAAFTVAEKIRSSIERLKLKQVKTGKSLDPITVSLGVASFRYGEAMEDFLNRCDEALYRAKKLGRNRSVIAE